MIFPILTQYDNKALLTEKKSYNFSLRFNIYSMCLIDEFYEIYEIKLTQSSVI